MNEEHFSSFVLLPALMLTSLYSKSSHVLMLGTPILESNLEYLEQIGRGSAFGIYQIEQDTYDDIARYLHRYSNKELNERCLSACFYSAWPPSDAVVHNLRWAAIIARIKYWMQPEPLPEWNDARGMVNYYRTYYNTAKGKSDPERCLQVFNHVISMLD